MAAPTYIPANNSQEFPFLHSLPALVISYLSGNSHSEGCDVTPPSGFDLHIPDDQGGRASFHTPVGYLYVFFG